MKSVVKKGGFFPTGDQVTLLKAAILPANEAIDHWRKWVKSNGFNSLTLENEDLLPQIFDPIDIGSERIMPMIHKNLEGFNDPLVQRLKGIHRYTWIQNQRILDRTLEISAYLNKQGIESIFIKGIPLSLVYYKDMGVRIMSDGDLLIPFEQREKAITALLKSELLSIQIDEQQLKYTKNYCHSIDLVTKGNIKIDLHWNLFHEYSEKIENDLIFWKKKEKVSMNGSDIQILSPTHQFFNSMAHGRAWNIVPPFRWVADCIMIYNKNPQAINWNEICELAHSYHYIPFFKRSIELLHIEFKIDIPNSVFEKLNNYPISNHEISYHHYLSLPHMDFSKTPILKIKRLLLSKYHYYRLYKKKSLASFIVWYFNYQYPGIIKRVFNIQKKITLT